MSIHIVVGTTSTLELDAVKIACTQRRLEVEITGCKVNSGVSQQPTDFREVLMGAGNRAENAKKTYPDADLWGGLENGLLRARCVSLDVTVIVILKKDGSSVCALSPGITLPEPDVCETERRGFGETTVGSVIAERLHGDPTDPHTALTNGMTTRSEALIQGVLMALAQLTISS